MVQIENLTEDEIQKDKRLKKTREAWIASNYLLFRTEVDGYPWYLRKNPEEDSVDDIYGAGFWEEDGKTYSGGQLAIQTFEIRESSGILIQAIQRKFKHDLSGVALVGYVMRDEVLEWKKIVEELSKIKHSAKEIVLIGNVGEGNFIISQIYPKLHQRIINPRRYQWKYKRAIESQRVFNPADSGVRYIGKALISPDLTITEDEGYRT